jgi:hypothetical protein
MQIIVNMNHNRVIIRSATTFRPEQADLTKHLRFRSPASNSRSERLSQTLRPNEFDRAFDLEKNVELCPKKNSGSNFTFTIG